MLRDHALGQERWVFRRREREGLPSAFGDFIAGLAAWDWFVNPISFRDDWRNAHRAPDLPSPKYCAQV